MASTRAIQHTYIVSPLNMAAMTEMAQTLAVYHSGYHTLKLDRYSLMDRRLSHLMQQSWTGVLISHLHRLTSLPFASHGRDHCLTASGFFPCSVDREYLMLRMDTVRHSGCVLPTTETRYYFIGNEAPRFSSTKPSRTGSFLQFRAFTTSTLIDYELTCYRLRSSLINRPYYKLVVSSLG